MSHGEILLDQVQGLALLTLDPHRDEAEFRRPVILLVGMQPHPVFGFRHLVMRQRRQQRFDARYRRSALGFEFIETELARFSDGQQRVVS